MPLLTVTPATDTKKSTFILMPLPKSNTLFALLKGAKYFTALDLHGGYYHIKLDEKSIPKSAFTTAFDSFEFLRLPFSLSEGPDFFICLIYDLFGLDKTTNQGKGSGYLAYLDGILMYSRTLCNANLILPKIMSIHMLRETGMYDPSQTLKCILISIAILLFQNNSLNDNTL